uniref:Pentapeptide repeat-containing protein n=1 Tax=Candidatus Kentrum sp. FM TaxID=2126340 RepID=A0A450SME2_9GAMM|nr:MAG: Pentapeptide repeat-containing protein [Candidatus Kentron sp. FM]VFJ57735.1 MAG: Pentapeptide repeat-containing protein [Candidatus Kentron sp. FM]VFK08332.1 MAG: Pentapeptide repeat-containing protein [Candidatus Kentron sp. FM]
MENLKKLPIGIQDFEKLRTGNHIYVDKTEQIYRLMTRGAALFLSRPRRFGKSLLVSTLKAIFQGRQDLFQGLWIADSDYDWPVHPVIQLDMSEVDSQTPEKLQSGLIRKLNESAVEHELGPIAFNNISEGSAPATLSDLIRRLAREKGKPVVLVDEYDKPILDNIADVPKAIKIRDRLRDFYTRLKSQDANLRFVFLTGVGRFSKVSVFSGLNQLNDITLDGRYATILGYTQDELESYFSPYIEAIASQEGIPKPELLEQIRSWYNGYRFHEKTQAVYNPHSCLLYFDKRKFKYWWFETGTPTFLVELIRRSSLSVADLEQKMVSERAFSSFEVDRLDPVPLLQQTGYLTITDYNDQSGLYTLDYPNREVREAFLTYLAEIFSGRGSGDITADLWRLRNALAANDPDTFFRILTSFFSGIPYDIRIEREQDYQSIFYTIFKLMGFHIHPEVRTATARIDATIELSSGIWIFEFKVDKSADAALAQIREKDYAGPYVAIGKPVYLVGVNFDSKKRTINEWKVERLELARKKLDLPPSDKVYIADACNHLARGDYEKARAKLFEIPETEGKTWRQIESEFGFVFNFDLDRETDAKRRERLIGQIEWRRKVFAVLRSDKLPSKAKAPDDGKSDVSEAKPKEKPASEHRGEKQERDILRLLRRLFTFNDKDVRIEKLRQQRRGAQLGFDIKIAYCCAANNRNVRCCVECKSHEKEIRFGEILGKLHDAEANQTNIDHWILIAPRARSISNMPDKIIEKWEEKQKWPFSVQFWMADTAVGSLFGLEPAVYDDWIDHPSHAEHPRDWSSEKRERTRQQWLAKLRPPLRLPQAWAEYVTDPKEIGLFMENDDRENLRELWRDNRYIPPGVLDESGAPMPGGLERAVRDWIEEGPRVCVVLGEFGDGKSAFTYWLSRELLAEFRENPSGGWLPVRFPLRYFARPNTSAREFLRDRLEELGSDIPTWRRAIVEERKALVILDGMDEMTKSLNQDAVRRIIDLLVDCCNRELERVPKILITCRRTFFEELAQRPYVTGKLKGPAIFHIEPFSKERVYGKLAELATAPEQRSRLRELRGMHDPIGLARKPLFFKMVSETLTDDADFSSETAIYRGYVASCLGRKIDFLENDQNMLRDDLLTGMLAVMEWIAMEMHLSDRDYVCLKKMGDTSKSGSSGREKFAALLWQGTVEDEDKERDAVHRVGVRSLLSRATGKVDDGDRDKWPVEFCHRSVREYFVARGIEKALREGRNRAEDVISRVDSNHEVLRFTAELMRTGTEKEGHDYGRVLRELANLSRKDDHEEIAEAEWNRRRRLGSTAVTLLFRWSGELEAEDWGRMILDGARLAGADLTGKNFYGASLRDANLNNAILDGADLQDADLTGVLLEEAGEMTALSVPRSADADHFFVAYRDGSVRRWSLEGRSDYQPDVIFPLSESKPIGRDDSARQAELLFDDWADVDTIADWDTGTSGIKTGGTYGSNTEQNGPLKIAALPGSGLCLWDRDSVWFLDRVTDKEYRRISRFPMERQHLAIAVAEKNITLLAGGETNIQQRQAHLFDLSPQGLPSVRVLTMDSCLQCVALDHSALAGIRADGRIVVHRRRDGSEEATQTATLGTMSVPTCIASHQPDGSSGAFLVACGNRDGLVAAWRFTLDEETVIPGEVKEVFRKEIHKGAVRDLGFVDGESLLTAGADGRIHRIRLSDGADIHPFELRLRCRGARIAGLEGKREREILEKAGALAERL